MDLDRRLNVFQTVFVCAVVWGLLAGAWFMLSGCATPPPEFIIQKPDIVEIEIPTPVLGNFGCQCKCECEPNKDLQIELEEKGMDPFLYNPLRDQGE